MEVPCGQGFTVFHASGSPANPVDFFQSLTALNFHIIISILWKWTSIHNDLENDERLMNESSFYGWTRHFISWLTHVVTYYGVMYFRFSGMYQLGKGKDGSARCFPLASPGTFSTWPLIQTKFSFFVLSSQWLTHVVHYHPHHDFW